MSDQQLIFLVASGCFLLGCAFGVLLNVTIKRLMKQARSGYRVYKSYAAFFGLLMIGTALMIGAVYLLQSQRR